MVRPLYFCSRSFLQCVYYETFIPPMSRLLVMSPTVVLRLLFSAITIFLLSTTVVFLGQLLLYLLLRILVVSSFFRSFKIVELAICNIFPVALIDFPFSQLKNGLHFTDRQLSPCHVDLLFLTRNIDYICETQN